MAYDLAETPSTGVQVQACGDCHLLNFGLFATAERHLVFDRNDFDETHPATWEWDLKRLVVDGQSVLLHVAGAAAFLIARLHSVTALRCTQLGDDNLHGAGIHSGAGVLIGVMVSSPAMSLRHSRMVLRNHGDAPSLRHAHGLRSTSLLACG